MNSVIFKPRNAILILLIFSLGLYYKTINAELLSLDDKRLIDSYNNGNTDIKNYFFPQGTHSYYRPVVHLSFLVDYLIWMDHESGFHLTNIILHSANVILVYILCLLMLNKMKGSRGQGVKGSRGQAKNFNPSNPRTLEPLNPPLLPFLLLFFLLFTQSTQRL
ncbi:MAG: hypothetical protein HY279_14865 [Nitrospinae bacterium]|nr:hypothetical protein [Nitrospinota bacterium]